MDTCTYGVTLDELLKRPTDLLVLVGADDDNDDDNDDETSDEDSDDDDEDDDSEDDEDDDADADGDDKSKEGKDKKKADKKPTAVQVLEDEVERQKRRRSAAEERVTRLLAENKELKTKGTKDETLKAEHEAATKENATLKVENEKLMVESAFLKANKYTWMDPDTALKLADLSDVTFEDGKAEGLTVALDKLAREKPFLLKKEEPKKAPQKSGDSPRGKSGGSKLTKAQEAAEQARLAAKYPALRQHI